MVECGSGEGVSSYNFSSPDRPTPYEGIRSISLLYRLMSVSAWNIYAAKVERCCRYSGVMRRIYVSVEVLNA